MEFNINRDELLSILSLTQSVVQKRTTMPILANILLSTSKDTVKASVTDLEIAAVSSTKADVTSAGSTTVNGKMFYEVVKELPNTNINVKLTEGERIEISTKTAKMKMLGVSAEEYPVLQGMDVKVKGTISAEQLKEMINKTIYAASLDESRFNLCGVCFELVEENKKEKSLRMAATDGYRISIITRGVSKFEFQTSSPSVIVPRRGLSELKRILDNNKSDVGIDITEGFFIIETDSTKVAMRLIDGEFPDYKKALPTDKGTDATMDSQELADALKRVALMVSDKAKGVKMDFFKDKLLLSSQSPELGEAREELPIQYSGKTITIGFNALYILDFITSIGEKQNIVMELHGEKGPARLRTENDESYTSIVMPMRLA